MPPGISAPVNSSEPETRGAPSRSRDTSASSPADEFPQPFGLLYGASEAMQNLYRQIDKVAGTALTVLIVGESGTGKELIAKTVHDKSSRSKGPFIPVNCGAIPASLIEGELFGHEKGSFTGALQQHVGYFENAMGGTIFLDEITEMAPEMQIKLLRVLETGTFHRVGGTDQVQVDVRVVAATNRDLQVAVKEGRLREDLLYRLAVIPLRVPPLRERKGDVDLLAQRFLDQLNAAEKTSKVFSRRALEALRQNPWPGNVRELKNTVHRAFILADHVVELAPSPPASRSKRAVRKEDAVDVWVGTPLLEAQREIILATLAHFGGDKRQTASTLGVSLKTLYNRLEAYKQNDG